ncbi:hypothetical protein T484DRAFT_1844083 [Baffinella frigidus]|nr:hypothetical protein T484DRAFT_1844083 [Cryptophyta sp. CCMP2293]
MAGLSTRGGAAASSVFVLACLVAFAAFASYGQAGKSLLLQLGSLPSLSVSTSGGRGRTGTTQLPQRGAVRGPHLPPVVPRGGFGFF